MNKRQQKQFNFYINKLNIKTEGERFVLEHILKRDWNRDILLQDISKIKYEHGLVTVNCRTRNGSYSFSVSHLGGKGWLYDDPSRQKAYISGDLYHKMD